MIKKVTLTKIWKDTTPTQYGSLKTNFQCTEYGSEWISGFAKVFDHREGDVVELDILESETINKKTNKPFINWKFPSKPDELAQVKFSLERIDQTQTRILNYLKKKYPKDFEKGATPEPNFNQNRPQEEIERDSALMKEAEEEAMGRTFSEW